MIRKSKKRLFISLIFLILTSITVMQNTFAKDYSTYTFYVTSNKAIGSQTMQISLLESMNEKTLTNGKIAPRNFWCF